MAEVVEYRIEKGIEALEFASVKGLLDEEEIKLIIRKRKNFEYKLQRPVKEKKHYLKYINYEQCLLKLIHLRRKELKDFSNQREIENFIGKKIKALYFRLIEKYSSDLKLWFSFIEFCKEMHYNDTVSTLFTRLIQLHNDNEKVWLLAAKWHFEDEHAADIARDLLLRAIRHFPSSEHIWHEYFRLECMFASWIHKRFSILESAQSEKTQSKKRKLDEANDEDDGDNENKGDDNEEKDEDENGNEEKNKDEDANMEKAKEIDVDVKTNDAIISGKVIKVVFDSAINAIKNVNFMVKFLDILDDFEKFLRLPLKDYIYEKLNKLYPNEEAIIYANAKYWLDKAFIKRELMNEEETIKDKTKMIREMKAYEKIKEIFSNGIEKLNTIKMWSFYIKFLLKYITKLNDSNKEKVIDELLIVFKNCWNNNSLTSRLFTEWLLILNERQPNSEELRNLLNNGLDKWPTNANIWYVSLSIYIEKNVSFLNETQKLFHRALDQLTKVYEKSDCFNSNEPMIIERNDYVDDDNSDFEYTVTEKTLKDVWILFINWSLMNNCAHDLLKLVEKYSTISKTNGKYLAKRRELCCFLKPFLLKLSSKLNIKGKISTRRYFELHKRSHPIIYKFHLTMINIELNKEKIDLHYLRKLFQETSEIFGDSDYRLWIKYIHFELKYGNSGNVAKIYSKACKQLNEHQSDLFTQAYSLIQSNDYNENDNNSDSDDEENDDDEERGEVEDEEDQDEIDIDTLLKKANVDNNESDGD